MHSLPHAFLFSEGLPLPMFIFTLPVSEWIFTGRTDAEAETPMLWLPDAKNWLTEKDTDAGKDWRQEEKRMTEDEMVGWHHQLNGHEFEQAPGAGDGQVSLTCCSLWGRKESDVTQWLNWTELNPFEGTAPGHYHVHSIMFIKILNNIHQNHQGTLQVFRIMYIWDEIFGMGYMHKKLM